MPVRVRPPAPIYCREFIVFTILHISDLHRSKKEPVDNDTLIAALLADRERYAVETPSIPKPDAIVVSGDLIQGAPIGMSDWQKEMQNQYIVAEDFLDKLAKRFVDGDRSKVLIIPGNHDVCWNTSFNSMERVPEDDKYPEKVRPLLLQADSDLRWDWSKRALYRIKDFNEYDRRLDSYWNFVTRFYDGVSLLTPIDPARGYQLFELCNRRIVVAAFDSNHVNDCFGFSGSIKRGTVARASLAIKDLNWSYDLQVALWHHSINGPPLRDDYMEVSQIHEMAGLGFQLGMHGHQHVAEMATHSVYLSQVQSMKVISAGSLCAGALELPRGVNRQYNVLVINDDLRQAKLHVRELVQGEQFSCKYGGAFMNGYTELEWEPRTNAIGYVIKSSEINERELILKAESEFRSNRPVEALKLLKDIAVPADSHARQIALQAAIATDDPKIIANIIHEPTSNDEAVYLAIAHIRVGKPELAKRVLDAWPNIEVSIRRDIEARIKAAKIMGKK